MLSFTSRKIGVVVEVVGGWILASRVGVVFFVFRADVGY